MLPTEVTTAELARLLGATRRNFPELAERKIIVPGSRKGTYVLEPSVSGYARHLRQLVQGRHGTEDAIASATVERGKLAAAQASLATAKAERMRGEVVPVAEVETFWRTKLKAFRNRILGIGDRMRSLPPREHVKLMGELRGALTDLADSENAHL